MLRINIFTFSSIDIIERTRTLCKTSSRTFAPSGLEMGSGHILSLSLLPTVTHTLATIDAKVITFIFATIKQPQRPSFPPVNHSSTSKMPPQMDDTTNDNEMSNTEMQPELSARLVNDQGQIRRRPTADEDRVSNGYVLVS